VARRNPEQFRALVAGYSELLVPHDRDNVQQAALRRLAKEEVVTRLGDASGGPRDLLDLHVAALDTVMQRIDVPPTPFLAFEARLLVLEAMGLLVDYYRVGLRASNNERSPLMKSFKLRLFVTGMSVQSQRAIANLTRICESDLAGLYEIEVIDVLEHPEQAESAKILATPTLVKQLPEPVRKIIGDLSDRDKVLVGLDIERLAEGRLQ
jgi:circadian clock protein KaiB